MIRLLAITAALEAAFGLTLCLFTSLVVELLFGSGISGTGIVMSRLAGISLIALAVACWPQHTAGCNVSSARYAMLTYNGLVTLYCVYLGIENVWVGPLLWPVAAIHAFLTVLLKTESSRS